MAWYGPPAGLGSDVRAAKAMPADTPEVVFRSVSAPDPVHPQLPAFVAALAVVLVAGVVVSKAWETAGELSRACASRYFFPQVFFRPPPAC